MTKEKDTTPKSLMTEEHWKRLDAMTEEELECSIVSDPDSDIPADAAVLSRAVVYPDGRVRLLAEMPREDYEWLLQQRIDVSHLTAELVHNYVQLQRVDK